MKTSMLLSLKVLVVAVVLALANQSHALVTPYLTALSNNVAFYVTTLTDPADQAQVKAVNRALKDLAKPSATVAEDYNRFFAAAIHLGPFVLQEPFGSAGSNVFALFLNDAAGEMGGLAGRIGALNDFVTKKKAASNSLARAQSLLGAIAVEPNPQVGLILGSQLFKTLVKAETLTAFGEEHSGLAADEVVGLTLHHTERNSSGEVVFTDGTNCTQEDTGGGGPGPATYTYTRTGLNTATLVITSSSGGGTNTVKMRFNSETGGSFTLRFVGGDGHKESGGGTFTLD